MQRTDYSSDIDGALAGRNAGREGFQEIARSGNGNMMTDLLADDGQDYDEVEIGEGTEEMSNDESRSEDRGVRGKFAAFRYPLPHEKPPYPAAPGKAWIRRRIRVGARRPGGNHVVKLRWVQVSPRKHHQLVSTGQLQGMGFLPTLGFWDLSSDTIRTFAIGAAVGVAALFMLGRKKKA